MSEYTAVHFGAMQTAEAEFASTYQALHSTLTTTLESRLQLGQVIGVANENYANAKRTNMAMWE